MYRDAEQQLKSALKQQDIVDTFLYLGKVYTRLDQPLNAIEVYKTGLEKFPGESSLLTNIARIYEVKKIILSSQITCLVIKQILYVQKLSIHMK